MNSDEAWRFDWKPGVRYLRGGVEVGIDDNLFPCGGDTVFGLYTFPTNSTPPDRCMSDSSQQFHAPGVLAISRLDAHITQQLNI